MNQEELKAIIDYDAKEGVLRWIHPGVGRHRQEGRVAGCGRSDGYTQIMIQGNLYLTHRLMWLWHNGYIPEGGIDHIDRNRSNNRIDNLREVSQTCNSRNAKLSIANKSGIKGVFWSKGARKWSVQIRLHGRRCHIGNHKELIEAACHRLAAEQCIGWEGCESSSPAYTYVNNNLDNSQDIG